MLMAFCRGCGKEISEQAPHCPQCGAPQAIVNQPGQSNSWMAIVAMLLSGCVLLGSLDAEKGDTDLVIGALSFSAIAIALAGISLHQGRPGKNLAVVAITVAVLALVVVLESTF